MPAIKVCGITRIEDAEKSIELGPQYIGLIFAQSPRQISPADARKICKNLRERVQFVGVFKNQDLRFVNDAADTLGLDLIQLHGDESSDYCRQMNHPVIKAIELVPQAAPFESLNGAQSELWEKLQDYPVHAYLFDRPKSLRAQHEWLRSVIEQFGSQMQSFQPFFIAGGLNAQNLDLACSLNPFAIDVASAVESEPGIKDHKKLEEFFQALQGAKTC